MNDTQARARVWTLCLYALVLAALTGPLAGLLAPLAHASVPALTILAAILAAALVGAYVALAVLLARAVLRVVRPRLYGLLSSSPKGFTLIVTHQWHPVIRRREGLPVEWCGPARRGCR